jgi:hypothetical protein
VGGFNWWLQRFSDVEVVAMSGGRKQAPRPVRAEFWERVRSGLSPRDAGVAMGMRKGAERWFALAGGVKSNGPGPVSGRYLSLAEREEIAIGVARGESYRVIGARIGRPASTISRELRRNGAAGRYRARRAQALAEERARRPKTAKLAGNDELRDWVQRHLEMKWRRRSLPRGCRAAYGAAPPASRLLRTACGDGPAGRARTPEKTPTPQRGGRVDLHHGAGAGTIDGRPAASRRAGRTAHRNATCAILSAETLSGVMRSLSCTKASVRRMVSSCRHPAPVWLRGRLAWPQ